MDGSIQLGDASGSGKERPTGRSRHTRRCPRPVWDGTRYIWRYEDCIESDKREKRKRGTGK